MSQTEKKRLSLENVEITEDGLSYQEISKILEIPEGEVKKIERRALMKLKAPNALNKKMHNHWIGYKEGSDTIT